jgi:DNA-binding transcriptional ArsR family regulator
MDHAATNDSPTHTCSPDTRHECARKLRVIADDTRFAVLRLLMDNPWRVGDLAERLNVEQSLMSHHLKVLKKAGLVEATRTGRSVHYSMPTGVGPGSENRSLNLGCCTLIFNKDSLACVPASEDKSETFSQP